MHPYLVELIDLDLPRSDFALFGSGPLLLRGWIDDVGDLDVFARGAAWDKAARRGNVEVMPDGRLVISFRDTTHGHPRRAIGCPG